MNKIVKIEQISYGKFNKAYANLDRSQKQEVMDIYPFFAHLLAHVK